MIGKQFAKGGLWIGPLTTGYKQNEREATRATGSALCWPSTRHEGQSHYITDVYLAERRDDEGDTGVAEHILAPELPVLIAALQWAFFLTNFQCISP